MPLGDQLRIGRQVRDVARKRVQVIAQDAGQIEQRGKAIEFGQRFVLGHQLVDPRTRRQQPDEGPGTQHQCAAVVPLLQHGSVTGKMHCVAQPLFRGQQDRLAVQRRAVPERLGIRRPGQAFGLPPPGVFGPAFRKPSQQQQNDPAVLVGFRILGSQFQRPVIAGHRVFESPLPDERRPLVLVRVDVIGLEPQRLIKTS